jgi:hypothetical protein
METKSICSICTEKATKYRCPKCDIKYCTLVCFKTHKISCEEKNTAEVVVVTSSAISKQEQSLSSSSSSNLLILSASQKDKLCHSKSIQDILKSKRLRDHISDVDSAPDRQKALRNLRSKNVEFDPFLQELLVTIKED